MRKLGSIFVELVLNDGKFKKGLDDNKAYAEKTGRDIEKSAGDSNQRRARTHADADSQIRQSTDKTYSQLTRGIEAAKLAYNQSLGPQKTYMQNVIETSKHVIQAAPGYAVATAAITSVYVALRSVRDEFIAGLSAVEDYQVKVSSMSAFLTTFNKNPNGSPLSEVYASARKEAEKMVSTIELLDARSIASGKELTTMAEGFIKGGVKIDLSNKDTADGFVNISNALKLLTAGQNQEIQNRQEIRALVNGEIKTSNVLISVLKSIDPEIKKHLKTWAETGETVAKVGALLSGFKPAAEDLEKTWAVVGSTLSTIHDKVLRGAFLPTYQYLINLAIDLKNLLMDSEGNLTPLAKGIQETIKAALNSFDNLLKIVGVGGALALGVKAINHMIYGTSVAAEVAAGSISKIGVASKLLFAAYAGWEIGKWLSDNFETARLAGILFVDSVFKAWEYLKFGIKSVIVYVELTWEKSINFMKGLFADFLLGVSSILSKVPTMGGIASDIEKYATNIKNGIKPTDDFSVAQNKLRDELKSNLKAHNEIIDSMIVGATTTKSASKEVKDYDWNLKSANEEDKKAIKLRENAIKKLQDLADSLRVKTDALDKSKASEIAALLTTVEFQKALAAAGSEGKKLAKEIMSLAIAFDDRKKITESTKIIDEYYNKIEEKLKSLNAAPGETEQLITWSDKMMEALGNAANSASISSDEFEDLYQKASKFNDMMIETNAKLGEKEVKEADIRLDKLMEQIFPNQKRELKSETLKDKLNKEKELWDTYTEAQKELSGKTEEYWINAYDGIARREDTWLNGALDALDKYSNTTTSAFKTAGDIIERSFKGMEDSIVEFAKNGKLSFSSLIDSMISDLIRFQIQQSITQPLAGMLKDSNIFSSIGSSISGLFGGGFNAQSSFEGAQADLSYSANGNAFNSISGLSNSIVSSPTMFSHGGLTPFANGGGILGEAGPEAVLPLQRTSSGKLGVLSSGGSDGQPQSVRIEIENKGSQPIAATQANVKFDLKGMVVSIITEDVRRGGPIRSAMSGVSI